MASVLVTVAGYRGVQLGCVISPIFVDFSKKGQF